jgi:hypothetical protein
MAEHKFKIGQAVYFRSKRFPGFAAPPGPYNITRRLPGVGGEFEYAIKSSHEDHERVARESELERLEDYSPRPRHKPVT